MSAEGTACRTFYSTRIHESRGMHWQPASTRNDVSITPPAAEYLGLERETLDWCRRIRLDNFPDPSSAGLRLAFN